MVLGPPLTILADYGIDMCNYGYNSISMNDDQSLSVNRPTRKTYTAVVW